MTDFRISRIFKVEATLSASVYLAASASAADSGSIARAWGILVPTGSASGSVNFDSGSMNLDEFIVGQPYVARVNSVVCNRDHVYILM